MELKSRNNVLSLVAVRLLDLRVRSQSDVTSAERRGVFGDLRVSRSLQSGEEEGQCRWCVVSSFASLSQLEFWSTNCRLPSFDTCPLSRNLSFISFFSLLIGTNWVLFLTVKVTDLSKIFFYILTNFIDISLCAETPFFHFEENLSTDNIRWMLSWTLVATIILCIR